MRRLTCFVGLLFVLAAFARADVIVGTNTFIANNVYPFGDSYVGEYQQIYTGAAFAGVETITGLEFASGSASGNTGGSHTVTLTIGLSTTSATVASMSTNYAANKGADFTQIFSGTVTYTPASNDTFDLAFPTAAFVYNPGLGNLLLDIVVASNSGSQVGFDATVDSVTSRVFNDSGTGAPRFDFSHGLVTDFVTVPEPASVLLLGSVVLLGTALRHKPRSKTSRATNTGESARRCAPIWQPRASSGRHGFSAHATGDWPQPYTRQAAEAQRRWPVFLGDHGWLEIVEPRTCGASAVKL